PSMCMVFFIWVIMPYQDGRNNHTRLRPPREHHCGGPRARGRRAPSAATSFARRWRRSASRCCHSLLPDGVFAERADGTLEFHAAEPPSDEDVARLLATIRRRVLRLLARRGLAVEDAPDVDPLAE